MVAEVEFSNYNFGKIIKIRIHKMLRKYVLFKQIKEINKKLSTSFEHKFKISI